MIDPFTGDLRALQDANKRIAELEAQIYDMLDGMITYTQQDALILKQGQRIAELEEFLSRISNMELRPWINPSIALEAGALLEKGKK